MTTNEVDLVINKLNNIPTPIVEDAIAKLGVRNCTHGYASSRLRCLTPELGIMCGYAITAEIETLHPNAEEDPTKERFLSLIDEIAKAPKPAVIVMKDSSSHPEFASHIGECMANIFKRLGAVGAVTDAAIRDLAEIKRSEFHCFAQGVIAGTGGSSVLRIQSPIQMHGLQIEPGDLLHGDINGLIKIPAEGRNKLLEAIKCIQDDEREFLDYLQCTNFDLQGLYDRLKRNIWR